MERTASHMQQILVTIPMPWPVYAGLLVLGLIAVALGARQWRKVDAADAPEVGTALTMGLAAAGVGLFGMMGRLPAAIPVYGYGAMLFAAFVGCTWLGIRLGRRVGIAPEVFKDLVMWLFVFGLVGARITFIWQNFDRLSVGQWFAVWDGGLVFYGSAFGGIVGFLISDWLMQKRFPYDRWKLLDCVAPCLALGLALGRLGCLMNGCCYGNVASDRCQPVHFPLPAAPRYDMTDRGQQTSAGFTVQRDSPRVVEAVDPGSPAFDAGLKPGDEILRVNGESVVRKEGERFEPIHAALSSLWPRGKSDLVLTVHRPGQSGSLELTFAPRSIGLFPTQIYETISMVLLLFFLVSLFPYRPFDGSLMVIFMAGYAVHRFLNEMLRTDTPPVAFGMTLSQNISIILMIGAVVLGVAAWIHHRRGPGPSSPAQPDSPPPQPTAPA